jgi:hypothetical protein
MGVGVMARLINSNNSILDEFDYWDENYFEALRNEIKKYQFVYPVWWGWQDMWENSGCIEGMIANYEMRQEAKKPEHQPQWRKRDEE